MKLLTSIALIPILTACHTASVTKTTPIPGNEISMLVMQSDFKKVASEYPQFTSYCIQTITRLELEQAWTKARMFEAVKERRKRFDRSKPIPQPPAP